MKMKFVTRLLVFVFLAAATACTSVSSDSTGADDSASMVPAGKVTIPGGARLRVSLIDGVSTNQSSPGDEFLASLAEPVVVDGKMVLEKGTKVQGRVVDVSESGRVKGRASIRLILTDILVDGKYVEISTKPFVAAAESSVKRDVGIIAGGAGIGAAIGAIAGGGSGAAKGAAIGGGAGTGTVLATKGKDLHYPPETRLNFTLAESVEL
jgi:hypothetical protein